MKTYGEIEKIAAAEIEDMAEKCGITEAAARAVRAAVKLALEDQAAKKKKLTAGSGQGRQKTRPGASANHAGANLAAASLADEAFAAEEAPDYTRRQQD